MTVRRLIGGRRRSGQAARSSRRRRWRRIVLGLALLGVAMLAVPSAWAYGASRGKIVATTADAPPAHTTVVLGAGVRPDGKPSRLLAGRLDIAAELYRLGRTERIVVSGTTDPTSGYDEPGTMRAYLVDAGVPTAAVVLDDGGVDTRATCERARDAFGLEQFLLVSQRFHLPRAVAICASMGLDVTGVPHDSGASNPAGTRTGYAREVVATIPAMWESLLDRS